MDLGLSWTDGFMFLFCQVARASVFVCQRVTAVSHWVAHGTVTIWIAIMSDVVHNISASAADVDVCGLFDERESRPATASRTYRAATRHLKRL